MRAAASLQSSARLAQLVERKTLNLVVVGSSPTVGTFYKFLMLSRSAFTFINVVCGKWLALSISGLVVEYIVAIDVTRVRFPADALFSFQFSSY